MENRPSSWKPWDLVVFVQLQKHGLWAGTKPRLAMDGKAGQQDRVGGRSKRQDEVSLHQPESWLFAEGTHRETECGGDAWEWRRVRETYTHEVSPGCPPRLRKRWIIHFSVFIAESKTSIFSNIPDLFRDLRRLISTSAETQDPLLRSCFSPSGLSTVPPALWGPRYSLNSLLCLIVQTWDGNKNAPPSPTCLFKCWENDEWKSRKMLVHPKALCKMLNLGTKCVEWS